MLSWSDDYNLFMDLALDGESYLGFLAPRFFAIQASQGIHVCYNRLNVLSQSLA